MRRLFVATAILLIIASGAAANPYPSAILGLYGDAAGTVDAVFTDGATEVNVYAVFEVLIPDGTVGPFYFSAVPPTCFNVAYVGESSSYTVAGNSQTSAYVMQEFANGTYTLMTITFSVQGVTPECCWFEPQLDEGLYWGIEGVWINPDEPRTCVSPVESSTWGAIKAMYQ